MTNEKVTVAGQEYEVEERVYSEYVGDYVPLINLHWITDEEWQLHALQDRLSEPEKYAALGEDVPAHIKKLRAWLDERGIEHE